jgi:hypothetical protein
MQFWKRRPAEEDTISLPHREIGAAVEIVARKEASKEMAEKAKAANRQLQDLLVENGFTLKIYLAAGGSQPNQPGDDK